MTCSYDVPKVDTSSGSSPDHKPLPEAVTDFIAEIVCGILEAHQLPSFKPWDFIPLPELCLFIQKVTEKAKVDVKTAIASMVLVSRLKRRLPKTAHGEYGTYHKIFLASLLVALKEFTPKTKEEELEDSNANETDNTDDTNNTDDNDENNTDDISNKDNSDTNLSQDSPITSDDEHDDILFRNIPTPNQPNGFDHILKRPVFNRILSEISGIYDIQEVERMEREFVWRLGGNDRVTDRDIREYVENNRHALGIC